MACLNLGQPMNIYIYRSLNVSEKKIIGLTALFLLMAAITIWITLPKTDSECLATSGKAELSSITFAPECVQKIIDSITFAAQISHIIKGTMLTLILFFAIALIASFVAWINRRPNS